MTLDREQVRAALPAYEIGGELGRGGWGVVLEARHLRLGREVAIKQLPRAFSADPSVRARFVAEARTLASLDHPHIVPVYDYVEVDGLCLLVMEKLTGGTLWSRFVTDGLTMETSCAIALAACAGLHAAHLRGILHRDVKPENLMFSATGVVKVTDFGIAKVVGGSRTMATRAGEVLGTPTYMAPEHARGEPLGPPADVYATGVLLYELLSGHLPFSDEGDALAVLYRHVHEAPVPLQHVAPDVPPLVADVVMKALAPRSEERHSTAEALGVALADSAGAAWGPGWASARADITVMGSTAIVAAIGHAAASSPPAVPGTPATVVSEGLEPGAPVTGAVLEPTAIRTPAPPTIAVRPTHAVAARHAASRPIESEALASLHELEPVEAPVHPRISPARLRPKRLGVVAAGFVALAAAVVAVLLTSGGGKDEEAAGQTTTTIVPPTSSAVTPASRQIFQDDFADAGSGWTQADVPDHRLAYLSGRYLVLARTAQRRVISDLELEGPAYRDDLLRLGDVAIEADAERIVPVRTGYGLICRRGETGEFYMGLVDSAGSARIDKVGLDKLETLAERPFERADASGSRRLRFECVGGSGSPVVLRLSVDGTVATEATDGAPLGPGTAGVVISSYDRAGSQVLFDNFAVSEASPPR